MPINGLKGVKMKWEEVHKMNITPLETKAGTTVQGVPGSASVPKLNINARAEASDGAHANVEHVKRMIEEINSQLRRMSVSLEYSRYGENGEKIAIIVANKETGEVIREIPSKEIQQLHNSINDLIGIILDQQA
jgi:flagellar protein FlaG